MKHTIFLLLLFAAVHTLKIFHQFDQNYFSFDIISAGVNHNGMTREDSQHLMTERRSDSHNNLLHFLKVTQHQQDSDDDDQSDGSQSYSNSQDFVGSTSVWPINDNETNNASSWSWTGNSTVDSTYTPNTPNIANTSNNSNTVNKSNKDSSFNFQSLASKAMSNSNLISKGFTTISGLVKSNSPDGQNSQQGSTPSQNQSTQFNSTQTPYLNPEDYDLLTSDYDELDLSTISDLSSEDIQLLDPKDIAALDQI